MTPLLLILILTSYILINLYVFFRIKAFTYKTLFYRTLIISLNGLIIAGFIVLLIIGKPHENYNIYSLYFYLNFLFLITFTFISLLFIFYLLCDFILLLALKRHRQGSRIHFRSFVHKIAVGIALVFAALLIYGNICGTKNFRVNHIELTLKRLPASYNGIKILHFSDTHLGSFMNKQHAIKGFQLILEQKVDFIFFTGDLVNITAEEAYPYEDYFSAMQPTYGKFAVLGNHDMSDYMKTDIKRDSLNVNTSEIISFFEKTGFTVLKDSVVLIINKSGDTIQIAGSYNWGKPPFKAYANPESLFSNINPNIVTILLTHDPSFWNKFINSSTSVDLTLSGHTHGMQLGWKTQSSRWSPISTRYKTWGGIYERYQQLLHVNTGFGFIGIPVRIGIYPEITLITLNN